MTHIQPREGMGGLESLLDRIETAAGPNEDLAIAILEALDVCSYIPDYGDPTASIDAAVALVGEVLPGWWITCGLCTVTGHASIGPDYNGPDRERLLREFPIDLFDHGGFDADLAPGDGWHRTCYAILHCLLHALVVIRDPTHPSPGGRDA